MEPAPWLVRVREMTQAMGEKQGAVSGPLIIYLHQPLLALQPLVYCRGERCEERRGYHRVALKREVQAGGLILGREPETLIPPQATTLKSEREP